MATEILKGHIADFPSLGELRITENGYLVLEDGVIQGVYSRLPPCYAACPVVDYGNRIVMQSFADLHLHAPQYPMLGMGMDLPLLEWLQTYTFQTEARFADTDFARTVYRRLARELIEHGTTRVCMFSSLHTDATLILMEELSRAGITGYVGKVNMDRRGVPGVLEETTEESIRETLRWLESCGGISGIAPILTPRFTPSCTDKLMAFLGSAAAERNLRVQSHLSENLQEMELVRSLHPDCQRYYQSYEKFGLWKDHTVMAHCVHSDRAERDAMRRANVLAVHCADSNVALCSGIAPVRAMLDEGVWVALGSDMAGSTMLHMLDVVASTIRSSKVRRIHSQWQEPFLTVEEALYLGTTAGHRWFGAGDGFAVGDRLHAIVLEDSELPSVRPLSVRERVERCVYRRQERCISAVWADGHQVL
ncbi:amidohydrolase family protein [Oscillibacter sp. MSJ-2]|uniref:Amidohydrolase family protein n=1 Tax=Dysosmobacter acutus TaxID=2841504 RepID=A0ABS6F990_9FIRM|nr:amidohydrolase family protein [Dysosmobacter acutus]MBU5625869.1 amidohydrolase family protein [Dysosmobacter acutus]